MMKIKTLFGGGKKKEFSEDRRKEEEEACRSESKVAVQRRYSHWNSSSTAVDQDEEEEEEEEIESEEIEMVPEEIFVEQTGLIGYTLINQIGAGAFSKVYRAVPDRGSKNSFLSKAYKQVAVKVIKKEDLSVPQSNNNNNNNNSEEEEVKKSSRQQVLKEVSIHKTVSSGCDQIVSFIDFQETDTYYYIIQELLDGGEIFGEIVKYTYFSEDLARHVIKQLALAVKHLHSLGVVHRDIKPENLLFESIEFIASPDNGKSKLRKSDDPQTKKDEGIFQVGIGGGGIGKVKLADFGLSKQIFQTNTTTPCGTVGYTAPEVVKDEKYSMKVDMWGVGCVLYTILCGFPPFYDEKIDVLTKKIAKGEYVFLEPWWDEISDGAKGAVKKLLELDPLKRYDIDQFLKDPWLNNYDCLRSQASNNALRQSNIHKKRTRRAAYLNSQDSALLYSPAAVAMRDAFDISNAVKRKEVEDAETKRQRQNFLTSLQEETEEPSTFNSSLEASSASSSSSLEDSMFQLKLSTSTIVKRRKEKASSESPEPLLMAGIPE